MKYTQKVYYHTHLLLYMLHNKNLSLQRAKKNYKYKHNCQMTTKL